MSGNKLVPFNILHISWVELTVLSDLKHFLTYKLIKDYSEFIYIYVRGLKS